MAVSTREPTSRHAQPALRADHAPELTLTDILALVSKNRRWFVALPLTFAVLFAGWSMSKPRTYTAWAAFAAHGGASTAGLTGLASQLGLGLAQGGGEGPAYFGEVIKSSAVLRSIADSSIRVADQSRPLSAVLGIEETDAERRRGLTAEALREMIDPRPSRETGIVRVGVTAESPTTASQIAALLLAETIEFNLEQRQVQAAKERQFAERQLAAAQAEANAAELRLSDFLVRNRQWQGSPSLSVEHDRLQRVIMERRDVAASLTRAFDQARIEEVRNVPRISVLEPAHPPLRGNSRGTPKKAAAGLLLGLVLAFGIVFGREYLRASALASSRADVVP